VVEIRTARPEDYDPVAAVVDQWWGRPILAALPRLFFDHFHRTSLVAERDGELIAFLVGILSPSHADEAYIHFVGVAPTMRGTGLGARLYDEFLARAAADGRRTVEAITSPVNEASIAFHRRLGFTVRGPVPAYNGPGAAMIDFHADIGQAGTAARLL
jgi:ribosomal protein S18 acetylase RimI-like enzyme